MAVAAWMIVIFYLSTKKVSADYGAVAPALVHFVEYGILAVLVRFASVRTIAGAGLVLDGIGIGWAAVYGTAMEVIQSFTPSRSADPFDVAVNIFGAVVGVTAAHLWAEGRKPGRRR